ncbi:MAG: sterol desaturase/sphingolipid hydroxylase (fatty acid hydroxylase superfamily) [Pirellulaceae bacterium]|jgi:sterol desaturase/sphingolipid hydroxylase (fatty acid hydroxylase superfamily)
MLLFLKKATVAELRFMESLLNNFDVLLRLANAWAGPATRLWPCYLLTMIGMCYLLYRRAKSVRSFFNWAFPAEIYFHKSHFVDIKLFFVSRILSLLGLFNTVAITVFVATSVMTLVGGQQAPDATLHPAWIAMLMVLANDFGVYWVHRVHHETRTLWPFHAVHHSAEVLTPVTVYRKHPLYDIFSSSTRGLVMGLLEGIMLGLFVGKVEFTTIAGINAGYALFNLLGSNFRHTHIWLSYGRVLEHILISPAQHQIHHSIDHKHYNTNYGEIFAIWDWMFGTLYIPAAREDLEFGLSDENGKRISQPHATLTQALIVPFQESLQSFRRRPVSGQDSDTSPESTQA